MTIGKNNPVAGISEDAAAAIVAEAFERDDPTGKRILLITPDLSRTCPLGLIFRAIHTAVAERAKMLDVMIALGTHQPLSEDQINRRFDLTPADRTGKYRAVNFLNHTWNDPAALDTLGTISADRIDAITDGLFAMDVPVTINKRVHDYDLLLIAGPVFPHEVVGFSGGHKYLFPGIAGKEILDFFHWLGAVITNPKIIGTKNTPVRAVLDEAAKMVPQEKRCFAMVVKGDALAGLHYGTPEEAWSQAADLSNELHVIYKDTPFATVLSCAPEMYDELWTGGKCMYKLEPVVADGGELIIYAPHIREIAVAHDAIIRELGYHVRDYFLADWERFKKYPWGVVAHSTHVRGIGEMVDGNEKPRVTVTLATGISEAECRQVCLNYRDPATINPTDYADREAEGILYVPHAGEQLYKLSDPPAWQRF